MRAHLCYSMEVRGPQGVGPSPSMFLEIGLFAVHSVILLAPKLPGILLSPLPTWLKIWVIGVHYLASLWGFESRSS